MTRSGTALLRGEGLEGHTMPALNRSRAPRGIAGWRAEVGLGLGGSWPICMEVKEAIKVVPSMVRRIGTDSSTTHA